MTLLKELNKRVIAYNPIYRQYTGSTTAGVLLSQIMYWFSKQDKFYKTNSDFMDETMLTSDELKTAKRIIKTIPFITISLEGIPSTTYYKIDWFLYQETLENFLETLANPQNISRGESHQLCGGNPTNCVVDIPPTNSKTTSKTTLKEEREREDSSNPYSQEQINKFLDSAVKQENARSPRAYKNKLLKQIKANDPDTMAWLQEFISVTTKQTILDETIDPTDYVGESVVYNNQYFKVDSIQLNPNNLRVVYYDSERVAHYANIKFQDKASLEALIS